jgi:hypothetical protein
MSKLASALPILHKIVPVTSVPKSVFVAMTHPLHPSVNSFILESIETKSAISFVPQVYREHVLSEPKQDMIRAMYSQ